ncbi:uncharacterized protein LOC110859998 [Folsomia candida]|uniref:uncharacterized protein LOC110859998 n=1 Tax=Folsomia candida TaxID=158441 RepID=UPI001605290E|nr:uncharacterized protein LOC110859998 [Folsomia candida]
MIQRVRQRQIRKTLLNVDDESEISAVAESKKIYREISPRSPMPGVPFGLELFVPVERILVRPQELPPQDYEAFTEHMHYDIIDLDTGKIFFAWETDVHGFGRHRVYTLRIVDFAGRPVLQVNNITTCLTSIFWILRCFGQTGRRVNVNKPDGTKLSEDQREDIAAAPRG